MILILGTTASGKSKLAFDLAEKIGAEIISIDSMKVYRRMDIGTAKPPKQARKTIKYHLIDLVEPSESFSLGRFVELANKAIEDIKQRDRPIVAVGGTALYIKALLFGIFDGPSADEQLRRQFRDRARTEGLRQLYSELQSVDPAAAQRISPNDARRIIRALEVYQITGKPISDLQQQWNTDQATGRRQLTKYNWTIIGLRRDRQEENKRINARVKRMLAAGLVDEVKALLAEDRTLSKQAACAIGYAEIIDYLNGRTTLDEAAELTRKNTRRFAKNQRTWFKTFQNINWLDITPDQSPDQILAAAEKLLTSCGKLGGG